MKFPKGSNLDDVMGILNGTREIHEIFTHIDEEMQVRRSWDVTLTQRYCVENNLPVVLVAIDDKAYTICKTSRGPEQHRLDRVTAAIIRTRPRIYCHLEDNSYVMIDGTHRTIKAYELGILAGPAWVLEKHQWEQFLVEDLPDSKLTAEELLKKESGF